MRIVAISDTHGSHRKLTVPEGDVLIHAGDFMLSGTRPHEITDFSDWLCEQKHKYKIIIAGNHDRYFETKPEIALTRLHKSITYLCDSGVTFDGLDFWGSPYQPAFCNWAFNVERGEELKKHWDLIPSGIDVLITHGPAFGTLDTSGPGCEHLGCWNLRDALAEVKPRLHICGHIHGGYGKHVDTGFGSRYGGDAEFISVNAAVMNEAYKVVNDPIVIDLPSNRY